MSVHSKPTGFAGDADAVRSPDELHGLLVHPHQSDGVDEGEDLAVEATRSNLEAQTRKSVEGEDE